MKVYSKAMLFCAARLLIFGNFLDQCKFIHQIVANTAKIVIVGADFAYCPLLEIVIVEAGFCVLLEMERKGFRH